MDTVFLEVLAEEGLLGVLLAMSLVSIAFLLKHIFKLYEQQRDSDKETMQQLFEAIALLREVRGDIGRRE